MTIKRAFSSIGFGLSVFTLIFTSCNNPKQQQEDLQNSVIAVHDSVMADMGKLMEKKAQLNGIMSHLDSLKISRPALDTAKLKVEFNQTIEQLASADDQMMDWMHGFNPDYSGKSHEEVMTYLNDQKAKINLVDRSIKRVLIKSDSLIAVYK